MAKAAEAGGKPTLEENAQHRAALLSLLSTLGVVIDPTTPGVSDSQTVIERK